MVAVDLYIKFAKTMYRSRLNRGYKSWGKGRGKQFKDFDQNEEHKIDTYSNTQDNDSGSMSNSEDGGRYRREGYRYKGEARSENYPNRRERWNIVHEDGMSGETSSKKVRGRHPPGLKGREIGMWYAQRSQSRTNIPKAPELSMALHEAHALNKALDGLLSQMRNSDNNRGGKLMKFADDDETDCIIDVQRDFNGCNSKLDSSMSDRLSRIEESDFKKAYIANIDGNQRQNHSSDKVDPNYGYLQQRLKENKDIDQRLFEELQRKKSTSGYQEMLKFRKQLPSYKMKNEILNLINEHQVVVLSGETGCGKTTQVAQFILDYYIEKKEGSTCHIVCTQPRRISAISVAQRVANERAELLGTSVGYQIRLEKRAPRTEGSILYCTTGIVMQWLITDPLLPTASHLILDEIHERDSLSDFIICISRDLLPLRPDLKVILMSATLNADQFSKYFLNCPMIHIPGFTYNVKELYLEDVIELTRFNFHERTNFFYYGKKKNVMSAEEYVDFIGPHLRNIEASGAYSEGTLNELYKPVSEEMNLELILNLLHHISYQPPGAVLIFLPGWENISKLCRMIDESTMFIGSQMRVIPLHSLMPSVNQREVFDRPPAGVRKVVIATNIAETSITIDDIVYVIDCGRIKMKNYDSNSNLTTLLVEWETLANARQRKGRAGRVQDGICYHLYTKARELMLKTYPTPEIQRTRLEEVILQVKILKLGSCKLFLSKLMDAPEESVVDVSLKMLRSINAVDEMENLTPLGFHLAQLPMDPLTGKMLLMGAIFSCLGPVLTVAASLSFKNPFVISMGNEKTVDKCRAFLAKGSKSDHLMLVNVYDGWEEAKKYGNEHRYIRQNFLSPSILIQLQNMRKQFLDYLYKNKFVASTDPHARDVNHNSKNLSLVKAIITAGLYPNVGQIVKRPYGKYRGSLKNIILPECRKVSLHPKSVNEQERIFEDNWFIYWEKIKSAKVFLYDTTMISNYPLLLFGEKLEYNEGDGLISVDDFVKISCKKDVAHVIKKLRIQLDELLEYKISHPGPTQWGTDDKEGQFINLVVQTLSNEKYNT